MEITSDAINRFMTSCDRAKKIIQMDRQGELNQHKGKGLKMMEEGYEPIPSHNRVQVEPNLTPQKLSTSKLPKEILESFKTNPIEGSILGNPQKSILDTIDFKTQGQFLQENKQQVNEIKQAPQITNSNVDYSMIKMIVEDCMKKYTSALKKSLINEQKQNISEELHAMKIGDKFSFITKNGDLYEADLKFIKNLNNKKG